MKILILCLLTARTCLGQFDLDSFELYNDTITEYLEKHPDITIANDEELAIAAKNLAAKEAQINAQNEKYAKGEASYSEKPGPMDIETDNEYFANGKHLGFKPRNESIDSVNTPEALAYFDLLTEKYNREEIPNFWDSRLGASVVGCFWWNEKQWIGDGPIGTIEPTDCGLNVCIPCEAAGHLKGWVTPVKDQASCGSCHIFATIAAAETALIKAGADFDSMDLSEQWTMDCFNGPGPGQGCAGGENREIMKFLIGRGGGVLIKESDNPYQMTNDVCKNDLPYWNPGYKLMSYSYRGKCKDEDIMRTIMESGSSIMAVMSSGTNFRQYAKGVLDDCDSQSGHDHMVLAVGWGTENGIDYWLLKNSWGSNWGDKGYIKLKRGTCGANYLCSGFEPIEEKPTCSKTTPCKTGEGHCDNNESCLSGNCGLKNCPTVDTNWNDREPGMPMTNCCFEAYQPVDIAIKTKCGEFDGTKEGLTLKLCQSQQQCRIFEKRTFDAVMGKYTECQEDKRFGSKFLGVPECCSFGSFTVPNGSTNCAATDNHNLSDLGDCAGRVFDFDKPIDGTLTLSEDIEGKHDGWKGEWIKIYDSGSSKVMKCKIEGGLGFNPFSDEQLWKLDGKMLENKKGLWKSGVKQKWRFTSKGNLVRIENIWKKKAFGTTNDISVKLENIEDNKDGQLWKKGEPDNNGYFSLENDKVSKFLTAVSDEWDNGILELKDPMKEVKQLDIVCSTEAPTTADPCIDIWKTTNCIRHKNKGRCNNTKQKKNCKKTCEEC